jgi:hypothetical protein
MKSRRVAQLLKEDHWAIAEGVVDGAPFIVRFRTPVIEPPHTQGYEQLLMVVWSYAPEGSGELPDEDVSRELGVFEDRLATALEGDAHAVVVAVLTFDGARQWVVYTHSVDECGHRICEMPQELERYPIEMTTEEDPSWSYLRNRILSRVNYTSSP